jgi:hypothetical protein
MHRLIAILLIPFFVVGNSLAHSHGTAAHLSPSQGRAHIHVGNTPQHNHSHESHGHSHHEHSHGHDDHGQAPEKNKKGDDSKSVPLEKAVDHESDAVYVSTADYPVTTSARISIELGSCDVVETVQDYLSGIRPRSWHDRPPLAFTNELPLYLLHAALRL